MIPEVVANLACPTCGGAMARDDHSLVCDSGHRVDLARQGYATLMSSRASHAADDVGMIEARARFLAAGWYEPIAARVADIVAEAATPRRGAAAAAASEVAPFIVDAGGGTGWWLARALERLTASSVVGVGLTLDLSRPAVVRAARAHPSASAVRCDVWSAWPLRDAVADVVMTVLAPRNPAEARRIVRGDGAVAVVTPGPNHLGELVADGILVTVESDKRRRLLDQFAPWFRPLSSEPVEWTMTLDPQGLRDLVAMGPSAHHAAHRASLQPDDERAVEVTASFVIDTFVPREITVNDGSVPHVG
ncbi:MAG: hypothetical protein WD007_01050 [Nitriliruptoraceae bacterium]